MLLSFICEVADFMLRNAQMAPRRREGRAAIVLSVVLLASLIAYKPGPTLRAW
jgi:hypothetical protein